MEIDCAVIYQDERCVLLDSPASIQFEPSLKFITSKPIAKPYPLPEKKRDESLKETDPLVLQVQGALGRICTWIRTSSSGISEREFIYKRRKVDNETSSSTTQIPEALPYRKSHLVTDIQAKEELTEQYVSMLNIMKQIPPVLSTVTLQDSRVHEHGLEDLYQQFLCNQSTETVKLKLKGVKTIISKDQRVPDWSTFYIPSGASFIMGDVEKTSDVLLEALKDIKLDAVVLDPPWPNRSVARKNSYPVNRHLGYLRDIPIKHLLKKKGVVAVWCTNKKKYINFVKDTLFPSWNLHYVATWIWLKITVHGDPLFDIHSKMRKPWEHLIIGVTPEYLQNHSKRIQEDYTLVSVPDYHSRKPSLHPFLKEWLQCNPTGLEVFGRSLSRNWITWGQQPVYFMNSVYWQRNETDKKP